MKCICGYEQDGAFDILSLQDSDGYWNGGYCKDYLYQSDNSNKMGMLYVCPKCGTVKFVTNKVKMTIKEIENQLGHGIEIIK